MEFTAFKVAGIVGGTSAASAGVYGIYHFYPRTEETIKSKLETEFRGTNVIFLHSGHSEWSHLADRYSKVKRKPKKEDGKTDLTLDEVKTGCTTKVNEKFKSSSDILYQQVKELCFLNANTLLQESGKSALRSSEGADHEAGKTVWDSYHRDSGQAGKGPKIAGSNNDNDLNGSGAERNKGGSAMYAGCNATSIKKMYDAESSLVAFKTGCI